ncbi:hypothetical protein NP493_1199g01000 [Ridgeia piscesae]|uniref:Uncharacterized protein n=1 Tax=Ridgeia piscesae TaxID=27915 RepID=A0AAD9KDH3_RIDPI|nr:hypothetical protein NP493_1199g01000 [Ridgeia piscesae]
MYNVVDENNYDFIVFQFHIAMHCYRAGHVDKGVVTWYTINLMPCLGISNQSWHRVGVVVRAVLASVYVDGTLLTTLEPFHTARGQVGIMAARGLHATVYFWPPDLKSKDLDYVSPSDVSTVCGSSQVYNFTQFLALDAIALQDNISDVCRIVMPGTVAGL